MRVQHDYRRKETLSPAFRVLLLLLACLLLLGGLGLVIFSSAIQYRSTLHTGATFVARATGNNINTLQAQSQETTQAFSTTQANIEATATSQANTATAATTTVDNATATATSLGDFFIQSTSGTPTFNNPLSDNKGSGKWDEGLVAVNTGCTFTTSNYHASEARQGYFQPCIAEDTNFSNFAFQIELTINKGNPGQAGMVLRVNSDNNAYYLFRIGTNGSYAFDIYNASGNVNTLVHGFSSAITTQFGRTNTLTVIAKDTHYFLYVNRQYVDSTTDNTLQEGKIGIVAVNVGTPIDVTVGNAQLWKL
ncbi:MAG: hypothetical protein NVSMB54_17700 [Ktedonobacteraceae bacterium]